MPDDFQTPSDPPVRSTECSARTEDLAMLIRRLCRVVARHDANNTVRAQALDYLHRKGLGGSPLKENAPNEKDQRVSATETVRLQPACDGAHSLHRLVRALMENTEKHRALLQRLHDESMSLNERDQLKTRVDALFDSVEILAVTERQMRPNDPSSSATRQ
jgi:hypothetical protein